MTTSAEGASGRAYLGRVKYVSSSADGPRFARVVPLVRSTPDGMKWEGEVSDPEEEFPDRGEVFWWDVHETLESGTYVQFHIRPAPGYEPPRNPEKYQVASSRIPIEVLDLRGRASERELRQQLVEDGLLLPDEPLVRKVMIWYDPEEWVGPVRVERAGDENTWKLHRSEDLSRLTCFRPPAALNGSLDIAGPRLFVPPSADLGKRIGFRNWMPSSQLVGSLLARIRKLDREAFDALDTTYAVFDRYQEVLEEAGLTGDELEQYFARRDRIEELKEILARNEELLDEAVSALMSTPEVQERLESAEREIYEELKKPQEDRIARELREQEDLIAERTDRVKSAEQRLTGLREKIIQKEEELQEAVSSFRVRLRNRLQDLTESPEETFAEFTVLRELLGVPGPAEVHRDSTAGRESRSPDPKGVSPARSVREVMDEESAREVLGESFRNSGLSPLLGLQLHGLFLSGATPILTGEAAYAAVSAYADAVTGGTLTWIPVAPTVVAPQDLLGWFEPALREVVTHPGGLLDVLISGASGNEVHLVVLEGFNRAPVESYLSPLLECRADACAGRAARTVPVVGPGLVNASSRYYQLTRVGWPSNVLLALIPAAGTVSYPTGGTIWRHGALLDTGPSSLEPSASGVQQEPSRLSMELWERWRTASAEIDAGPIAEILRDLQEAIALGVDQSVTRAVYSAARVLSISEEVAIRLALESSWLPSTMDFPEDRIDQLERHGMRTPEIQRILEVAARLVG